MKRALVDDATAGPIAHIVSHDLLQNLFEIDGKSNFTPPFDLGVKRTTKEYPFYRKLDDAT